MDLYELSYWINSVATQNNDFFNCSWIVNIGNNSKTTQVLGCLDKYWLPYLPTRNLADIPARFALSN